MPGKFKDELCAGGHLGLMKELVGLRAKVYSYSTVLMDGELDIVGVGSEVKKLKGIKKNVVQQDIEMADYRDMIQPIEAVVVDLRHGQVTIRSRQHVLYTERHIKRSLSSYDDKCFVLGCGVHTMAYGHRDLAEGAAHECPFCADPHNPALPAAL